MKSVKTICALQTSLLAAGLAFADVTPQPADLTTGSNWRTAANTTIEPDGQYGTAGYVLFGLNLPDGSYTGSGYNIAPANANNLYSLSSFVSGVATPPGVSYSMWSGNGNFGRIQNPAAGNALTATTALLSSTGLGTPCDLAVQRLAGGAAFRLTVMIGVSSDGGYPNAQTVVSVNAGSGANLTGFAIDPAATVVATPLITQQPVGGLPGGNTIHDLDRRFG